MDRPNLEEAFVHQLEFTEAAGWADFNDAAPPDWGGRVVTIGGASVQIMPPYDSPVANRVIGLGLREPATGATIDEILALYRQAGVTSFALQICPVARPPSLPELLAERGLRPAHTWVKMFRKVDEEPTAKTTLRIEQIGRDYAEPFSRLLGRVFEVPEPHWPWFERYVGRDGWRHYLAFDGETPVAAAAMFLHAPFGALLGATTLPAHRNRGAQSALLARRINDARAAGCQWMIAETWEEGPGQHNPSYHNMLRAGFRLAYARPNYMLGQ